MTGGRYDLLLTATGSPAPTPSSVAARSRRRKTGAESVVGGARASRTTRARKPPSTPQKDSRGPRRRKLAPTVLIETPEDCRKMVRKLGRCERIAVDCEGVALSRKGKLCLVQIASQDAVYFFDLVGRDGGDAGRMLFEEGGLKGLLEDPRVWKVTHDCRSDSDALYHQFGVKLGPVIDTQVVFSVLRKARGMPEGLPVSMRTLLKKFAGASEEDLLVKHAVKDEMRGDDDFWLKRPLSEQAMQYARVDVEHLLYVTELLGRYINSADKDGWARVLEGSKAYVSVFRDDEDGPRKAQLQYEQLARVARRQRVKYEKEKRVEIHQRTDPMRKFSFDVTSVLQALAI